jgi:uncharacterized membrane protein YeaQ/YmgE (transglycosylase-associated protein family)
MNRNTLILALLALIIVALTTPFQLLDIPVAPFVALILGAIAGWWVARSRTESPAAMGAKAGAIVGTAALIGSIIGLAVLAFFVGNIPEVQSYVQSSEPHPEARIDTEWIAPLGALAGVVVGFIVGVFDLILSAVAGWIAGVIYGQAHHVGA